jgi:hypothetical protein
MTRQSDPLDRLRVASPCTADWQQMVGDERVRFCHECNLSVYNISRMTRKDVESLMTNARGRRLCIRLYQRMDGTVITQDCPVGLRALRRRVSRVAGAAFAALMSLCMSALGQERGKVCTQDEGKLAVKIEKTQADTQDGTAAISGIIKDPMGAAVAGARITLVYTGSAKEQSLASNDEGEFQFLSLAAGSYTLQVEMAGFKTVQVDRVEVRPDEVNRVAVSLEVGEEHATMVTLGGAWGVDLSSTSVTTTITDREFQHLPVPE